MTSDIMSADELNEIMVGLGLSRRDLARRLSAASSVDGKSVADWRKGTRPVPPRVAAWLRKVWAARHDPDALDAAWENPPLREGEEARPPEPVMGAGEFLRIMLELDLTDRLMGKLRGYTWDDIVSWQEGSEAVDPPVAAWLRRLRAAADDDVAWERIWMRPPAGRLDALPVDGSDAELDGIDERALLGMTDEWVRQSDLSALMDWASGELRLSPGAVLAGLARFGLVQSEYLPAWHSAANKLGVSGLAWKLTPKGVEVRDELKARRDADKEKRAELAVEAARRDPSPVPGATQSLYARITSDLQNWSEMIAPFIDRVERRDLIAEAAKATYEPGMPLRAWERQAKAWMVDQMQGSDA